VSVPAQVRQRAPRPPPGPPVEVMIWRVKPKETGRGEHRELVDTVKALRWEYVWQYRHPGPGRYRCEFRDARRQIVKVQYINAMPREQGGGIVPTKGRYRPPKRTVPPPVDAWDQQTPTVEQHREATQAAARAAEQQRDLPRKASEPRRYPPLSPPGVAPQGTFWRLRKNDKWEPVRAEAITQLRNYALLSTPQGEYIYVYAPDGRWPGYEWRQLQNGARCLVSRN